MMTLFFTIHELGFLGPEKISNLIMPSKDERIEVQKKAAAELLDNARKNVAFCQIGNGGQQEYEVVVCADHTKFDFCAGIEVVIPQIIIVDYPADRIEMARAVVWLDTKQIPLKVSYVSSNNLKGMAAKFDGDNLIVFKEVNGDVCCTAMVGPYLENVRKMFNKN